MRGNAPHVITAMKRNTNTRTAHAESIQLPLPDTVPLNSICEDIISQSIKDTHSDMSLQATRKKRNASSEGFNITVKKIPSESYIRNRKGSRKLPTNKGRPQPQRNINMLGNTTSVPTSS